MKKQNIIFPSLIGNLPSDNFLFCVIGTDNEHIYSIIMNHYINMSFRYCYNKKRENRVGSLAVHTFFVLS